MSSGALTLDYDGILSECGSFGVYQCWILSLLMLPAISCAFAVYLMEVIAVTVDHRCLINVCENINDTDYHTHFLNFTVPIDDHLNYDNCHRWRSDARAECVSTSFTTDMEKMECEAGFVFDHSNLPTPTLIEHLGLVCNRAWMKNAAQSSFMVGMVPGLLLSGLVSDRLGRRVVIAGTGSILMMGSILTALLPISSSLSFVWLVLARFLTGLGGSGVYLVSYGLLVEFVDPKYRAIFGCLMGAVFALGGVFMGLATWLWHPDWRVLVWTLTAHAVVYVFYVALIPESPRWLISQGRISQLRRDVHRICVSNNTAFPSHLFDALDMSKTVLKETNTNDDECNKDKLLKRLMSDLLWPWPMLLRTSVLILNWLTVTLLFYAVTMTSSSLSNDVLMNFSLLVMAEVPGQPLAIFILRHFSRNTGLAICQAGAGATLLAAAFTDKGALRIALALMAKLASTSVFSLVYVLTAELYATNVRHTALGLCATLGRVGGVAAPLVSLLANLWPPLPLVSMGTLALLSALAAFFCLPDTHGGLLPETKEEALALRTRLNF